MGQDPQRQLLEDVLQVGDALLRVLLHGLTVPDPALRRKGPPCDLARHLPDQCVAQRGEALAAQRHVAKGSRAGLVVPGVDG